MEGEDGLLLNFGNTGGDLGQASRPQKHQKPRSWSQRRTLKKQKRGSSGFAAAGAAAQPQHSQPNQVLKGYSLDAPAPPVQRRDPPPAAVMHASPAAHPLSARPSGARPQGHVAAPRSGHAVGPVHAMASRPGGDRTAGSSAVHRRRHAGAGASKPTAPLPQAKPAHHAGAKRPHDDSVPSQPRAPEQQQQQQRKQQKQHDQKRVGRQRILSREAGDREATPDQDDIRGGSDVEEEDFLAAVAASLSRDKAAQADLVAQRQAAGGDSSDSEYGGGGADDMLTGVVDFDAGGSAYPMIGERRKKERPRGGGGAAGGHPGMLTHAGDAAAAAAAGGGGGPEALGGNGNDAPSFQSLGLSAALSDHLATLGFTAPTRVQHQTIPALLAGRDALVNAPTGSGKTLAYLAPILQDLAGAAPRLARSDGTHALVIAPTRELCLQVVDVLTLLARRFSWLVPGTVHGGESRAREKARLRKGITMLVATPGRLLDHLENTSAFRAEGLKWMVLDEADRLLDLGFEKKVAQIIGALAERSAAAGRPMRRQSVLLSATLHASIGRLASLSLQDPVAVGFKVKQAGRGQLAMMLSQQLSADDGSTAAATPPALERFHIPQQLRQRFMEVPCKLRLVALAALLKERLAANPAAAKAVVFFSNCDSVEFYHKVLAEQWGPATGEPLLPPPMPLLKLHGNMEQAERTAALLRFTSAGAGVLLCTDVAARGLDFPAVTSIIQFDPAGEAAEYVHRVGRTARLGQAGEAVLFVLPAERGYIEHLRSYGVHLTEEVASPVLNRALGVDRKAGKQLPLERHHGAFALQRQLMEAVAGDRRVAALAADAFRSYVRAYATHASDLKQFFHIKALHLGHVAHSFALQERPGLVGRSALKEGNKRRKADALKGQQRDRRRRHGESRAKQGGGQGSGGYVLT